MSYVGEAGWEITCLAENASAIYSRLTEAGAKPAGLFAQTSMRIEKGFCAMGHELDGDITPIEAGLGFAVRKNGNFTGANKVNEQRTEEVVSQIISLVLDDENAFPLGHEPIYLKGELIGQTSSCGFGYRAGKPVALAHVNKQVTHGAKVQLDIARTLFDATVVKEPLYDPEGQRMRL
jgi:4-methylaminobutanoate oxidase (formaldehyde-forming)